MTPVELHECSICLDIIQYDVCTTSCNHMYHANCLTAWYNMGRVNCPLCRAVQIDENYQNNNENYQNNNENYQNNNENYQNNNENNNENNLYIENLLPNWMDIIDYNYILQDMNNTIHTNNVENILVVN